MEWILGMALPNPSATGVRELRVVAMGGGTGRIQTLLRGL